MVCTQREITAKCTPKILVEEVCHSYQLQTPEVVNGVIRGFLDVVEIGTLWRSVSK